MGSAIRQEGLGEGHLSTKESGVFTWDLGSNTVQADSAVANLFGLDPKQAFLGLPIEKFVERMHIEDKARVAQSIHHAIISGDPYHEEYRVFGIKGAETHVMAFGRCFRDAEGIPANYAGIVFPAMTRTQDSDPVLSHIAMAHRIAIDHGRLAVADALETILEDLSRADISRQRLLSH